MKFIVCGYFNYKSAERICTAGMNISVPVIRFPAHIHAFGDIDSTGNQPCTAKPAFSAATAGWRSDSAFFKGS